MATLEEMLAEREKALGAQPVPTAQAVQLGQAKGQVAPGNVDLNNRPVAQNADGSVSTVRSISINEDGKEILIPTVAPSGQVLTDEGAIAMYHATGKNLGVFDNAEDATAYAQQLHKDQEAQYAPGGAKPSLEDALAAREAELSQGGGFDSGLGNAVSTMFGDATEGAISNFLGGANKRLAQALSLPGAAVDEALKAAGMEIFAGADPKQTGLNTFGQMLSKTGVNTTPEPGLAADMGSASIDTALTTAALFAAAPAWAARAGMGVRQALGDFIQKNPLLFAAGDQASVPGSVLGAKGGGAVGKMGDDLAGGLTHGLGENIGTMVGGTLGGTLTGLAAPIVARNARGKVPAPIGEPIDPQGSRQEITRFAQEQIAGDLLKVDNDISAAVNLVKSGNAPEEASAIVRKGLEAAQLKARNVETSLWNRVDKTLEIDPTSLRDQITEMRNNTAGKGAPGAFPADWARDLMQATSPKIKDGVPTPVSAEHLLNARSELRAKIRAEGGGPGGGNRKLIANMEELDKAIMDQLAAQLPDDQALATARQFSYDLNERFTRGPVGNVLQRTSTGGDAVDPGYTMQALLDQHGRKGSGVAGALDVARGIPGAPQTAQEDLVPQMEDAVRSYFQQTILDEDPAVASRAAQNFLKKNGKQVKELGTVAGDIKQAVDGLKNGVAQKKLIQSSALAKWAEAAPSKVVNSIFSSNNPKKQVQQLLSRGMADDADAIDGLRSETIQQILRQSRDSKGNLQPGKMKNILDPRSNSAANDAYREIFTPEQYSSLRQIAADAAEADLTPFGKGVRIATTASRFAGSMLVGLMTNATGMGGGSIIAHSAGAKLAQDFTETQFKRMPAGELLELAILSPQARAILRRRAPSTAAEMRAIAAQLRRVTSMGTAAVSTIGGDNEQ